MLQSTLALTSSVCTLFRCKSDRGNPAKCSKFIHFWTAVAFICSAGTFILDHLRKDLGISWRQTSITIKTINGDYASSFWAMEDLHIANISNHTSESWTFWKTYTRSEFPLDNGHISNPSLLKKWKYLGDVISHLSQSNDFLLGCSLELTAQKHWNQLKCLKAEILVSMPLEQGMVDLYLGQ